jgi:hypothetical protein
MRLLLATLAALVCLAPAAQAQTKIQPGAMLQTETGQCTLNFVFDGLGKNAGKTYIGTAAHCGEKVGQDAMDSDQEIFGQFAFFGKEGEAATDYAFIEVAPEHLSRVDPAMKGHPEYPAGFTTPEETSAGDLIQMSGYGLAFGETQPTQEMRQTVLQSDDSDVFTLSGPSVNGDSGGPFVHVDTGKALGIVSQYGFFEGATDIGPTIDGVLAKAAKAGFPVALRNAGQVAPVVTKEPQHTQPHSTPPPATQPAPPPAAPSSQSSAPAKPATKKASKSKRQKACEKKAKKTKNAKKRKAALKRCAKRG